MKSRDSEDISLKREVSLESLFCLLSNQTDHRKNTGGGYRNAFCFIETVGLLENSCGGEGEWSGMLETANQRWIIHTFKENLYFFEYFGGFSGGFMLY